MANLEDSTLVYVAPSPGAGGVGDYSADLFTELGAHFGQTVYVGTGGAGGDTLRDIARTRRRVREVAHENAVVHYELSAGSVAPYWAIGSGSGARIESATIHDAPNPVWWPLRSAGLSRHALLNHAAHYPVRRAWHAQERRRISSMRLVALTHAGRDALARRGLDAHHVPHFVPERPGIADLRDRPAAVGLFGHVYGGKGFDALATLRSELPAEVGVVVAGRGTESLPSTDGVTILGEVTGAAEDDFFGRVRAVLIPYSHDGPYGVMYGASGVVARAFAYGTPAVASPVRAFPTEADGVALRIAQNRGLKALAQTASELIRDPAALESATQRIASIRNSRNPSQIATRFVELWRGNDRPA